MRMPTPIDQLPSFSGGGNMPSQSGSNKWLPVIIVGGIILISIGVAIVMNKKSLTVQSRKKEDGEEETPNT